MYIMLALVASRQHSRQAESIRHCQCHWKNYEEKVKKNTTQEVKHWQSTPEDAANWI